MTREEQIELMRKCIADAENCLKSEYHVFELSVALVIQVAFKFFDYRARQRDESRRSDKGIQEPA